MTCSICAHAETHGSWPQDLLSRGGTHCHDCHRSWAGKREAHCPECHEHFSADSIADKHRRKGTCLSRDDMLITASKTGVPLFRLDTSKYGEIWRGGESLSGKLKPAWLVGAR